ncbi:MAG: Hpt domain-containing protein, partial [Rudaea sp.]
QLPDYLERLQSGHKDIPIILLPLLNDLRAARGEKLLTESVLFAPDLNAPLPLPTSLPLAHAEMRPEVTKLRNAYQVALLRWIREDSTAVQLGNMTDVLDRLYAICSHSDARRLWWVANGVVDGVRSAAIDTSVTIKLLFGKVDREIKILLDEGEDALDSSRTRDLTKNFLYYLAHANVNTPRASQIRDLYKLDTLLPSASELEHAQGSISGHNRALLDTVAAAIKEDLLHVKEALDIFLRTQKDEPGQLLPQVDVLDRVADTLGMLGLGVSRQVIVEQRQVIGAIASGHRAADESALLDVAGSLLYVEASLDDHIERLGGDAAAVADTATGIELPQAEVGRILDALMREAAANLAQAKHDMVAFVEAPWDHAQVEQIPRLLEEVSGALDMLALHDAAQLINGVVLFVETELLQYRRVPNHEQMDALADALASIEYYIEATREQRGGRERILDITRTSLRALNYWPLPGAPGGPASPGTSSATTPRIELDAPAAAHTHVAPPEIEAVVPSSAIEAVPEATPVTAFVDNSAAPAKEEAPRSATTKSETMDEQQVADPDAVNHGVDFGFSSDASHTFDDEIRDIFLEEVQEEIGGLQGNVPKWCNNTGDFELLKTIRRSFHTLKGSSRLVGALALGDFSWKIENMLNRVLDKSIRPGSAPQSVLGHAVDALPDLLAALQGGPRPGVDTVAIKDVADRVALGDEAFVDEATLRPKKFVAAKPVDAPREEARHVDAPTLEMPIPAQSVTAEAPATREGASHIDPMLFEVLRSEVGTHLGVIDTFVASSRETSIAVSEIVLRAVHTLNGAIAMVDLPQLSQVLMPLEHYVKRLHAWEQAPDADGIAALGDASTFVKATIAALEQSSTALPDATGLAERVHDLAQALPEPELLHSLLASEGDDSSSAEQHDTHHFEQAFAATPAAVEATPAPTPRIGRLQAADEEAIQVALAALAEAQIAAEAREAHAQRNAGIEPLIVPEPAEPILDEHDLSGVPQTDEEREYSAAIASETIAELAPPDHDFRETVVEHAFDFDALDDASFTHAAPVDAHAAEPIVEQTHAIETIAERASPLEPADRSEISAPLAGEFADHLAEPVRADDAHETAQIAADSPATATHGVDAEPAGSITASAEHLEEQPAAEAPIAGFEHAAHEPMATVVPGVAVEEFAVEAVRAPAAFVPQVSRSTEDEEIGELQPMPQIDEDLLEIFIQEATEILDHADALMARLRQTPNDREIVTGLQRDLHTVKGGAHMSALASIGDLGHAMESLFEAVSENRREMTPSAVEALEAGFDRLHGLVQLVGHRQPTMMPSGLIRRIEGLVSGDAVSTIVETAPVASAQIQRPTPEATRPIEDEEAQARGIQEYIRVRADLLDTMVNTAGEVAIYRSRLEQQVSGYRYNLVELDATVTRLREQLRKLELETEAQILSRYQRADEAGLSAFDPLELDRFSTLQQLSRSLSESVSDLSSIQGTFDDLTRQSETLLLQQSRVNSDLQEGLMRTRMVPFDSLVPALRRTLRQTASELGKRAQLRVEGAQGEMDRNLLDRMKA